MEGCKTLFCSSEFPWVREIISSKCIDNLGMRSKKISLTLVFVSLRAATEVINNIKSTLYVYIYIRGVTGGTDQTSGGCSLCYTIPI